MKRYILIGMRGVGKTTVGKVMALLNPQYTHYDTDEIFEQKYCISTANYISSYGVEEFRKHEAEVLQSLLERENIIISTGGGVITTEQARAMLLQGKDEQHIVFLHAPLDTLYKRRSIQEEKAVGMRPLLYNTSDITDEITLSWQKRKQWYYMLATKTIYTNEKSPEEVAQEILSIKAT